MRFLSSLAYFGISIAIALAAGTILGTFINGISGLFGGF